MKKVIFESKYLPWLLLAPQLAIILIFFYLPAIQSLISSIYRESTFGSNSTFVGLSNYLHLFNNKVYYKSVGTTLIFSIAVTIIGLVLSLFLAILVNNLSKTKSKIFYQTCLVIPYAIAPAIIGTLMYFIFNPTVGILTSFFAYLGIDWNPMLNGAHAFYLIVATAIWGHLSYNFLFFLAGLQSIPTSVLEASSIDGANAWRQFIDIIFPLLAPITFFLLVINIIYACFETFSIIDVITSGGPNYATNTMVYNVYLTAFKNYNYGSSGAQSVILIILISVLTLIQFKYIEKKIHY